MSLRRRLREDNYFPLDSDPGAEQWHKRSGELWRAQYAAPAQPIMLLQLTQQEKDAARDAYETMNAVAICEARDHGRQYDGLNSAALLDKITLAINEVRWRRAHEHLAWHSGTPAPRST
jgi:hypothetical protein